MYHNTGIFLLVKFSASKRTATRRGKGEKSGKA
jgi:hypothetical protein